MTLGSAHVASDRALLAVILSPDSVVGSGVDGEPSGWMIPKLLPSAVEVVRALSCIMVGVRVFCVIVIQTHWHAMLNCWPAPTLGLGWSRSRCSLVSLVLVTGRCI
jgi:hypothetical protein